MQRWGLPLLCLQAGEWEIEAEVFGEYKHSTARSEHSITEFGLCGNEPLLSPLLGREARRLSLYHKVAAGKVKTERHFCL